MIFYIVLCLKNDAPKNLVEQAPDFHCIDRNGYIGEVLSGGGCELIHSTTQYMSTYGWGRAEAGYGDVPTLQLGRYT
ncbi:MAG: hypothetical protein DRP08_04870 [Candidatus Aenigmatarchaeota archaeon]|nr:MAG: hypothetical protein DRP08_04870 [Candidatus Aenigmarchaeota archaeon]